MNKLDTQLLKAIDLFKWWNENEGEDFKKVCIDFHDDIKNIILFLFEDDTQTTSKLWSNINKKYINKKFNNKLEDIINE